MGARGTDVAREAAAVVLLEDDFGAILRAIRLGRRIFDKLRKAMGYIVALHVPIAGMAFLPLAFGLPAVLGPLHIAFLELVIDPVCSLAFEAEPEEANVMRRPPKDPQARLLPPALIAVSVLQGLVAFATDGVYLWAWHAGLPAEALRSVAFTALIAALVALILVNRSFSASPWEALQRFAFRSERGAAVPCCFQSRFTLPGVHALPRSALARPNPVLLAVLGTVVALLALVLALPPAAALFRLEGFAPWHAGLALANGAAALLLLEAAKRLLRGRFGR